MTLQLKPEQEQVIGRAIQAGLIRAADDVLDVGIETIRQRLEERRADGCGAVVTRIPCLGGEPFDDDSAAV